MRELTDDLQPEQRRLLTDIQDNGLHVVHVPAAPGAPGHSYTVGLWSSFGQAEVIVFGLEPGIAGELLESVADEADAGRRFEAGSVHDGLLHGYPVRFLAVPQPHVDRLLAMAKWAHQDEAFPVVQLLWPDHKGRWPWQDDARQGFKARQPVLERMPPLP